MNAAGAGLDRNAVLAGGAIVVALAALTSAIVVNAEVNAGLLVAAVVAAAPLVYSVFARWERLLTALLLVILFIPIKRYRLPGNLPFDLEAYRVIAALVIVVWIAALLIDPRVRLQRSILDRRIGVLIIAVLASEVANLGSVSSLSSYVIKSVTFLLSYVLIFYVITCVARTSRIIDVLVKTLVGGGSIVAFFAIVERRTQFNIFDHLHSVMPALTFAGGDSTERGGHFRAIGSAQHPIALSAVMVVILPLAYYLIASSRKRIWWVAGALLLMGNLATASRTGIVMLLVAGLVLLMLRGTDLRRFWPLLLPGLIAIHIALPGALGSVRAGFFPKGGLIAQQRGNQFDIRNQNSRLSRIGPSMHQVEQRPLFGLGYGTRITGIGEKFTNAEVLDDQWLGSLLETGLAGIIAWVALIWTAIRRFAREGRIDTSPRGTLLVAITASIAAYAVGMFTYDAFSFIQVTFVFWILLALGSARLRANDDDSPSAGTAEPAELC